MKINTTWKTKTHGTRRMYTRNYSPSEVKFPVEAAPGHVRGCDVLESLVGDDVYDGAHHAGPGRRGVEKEKRYEAMQTQAKWERGVTRRAEGSKEKKGSREE